jgi:hypothetical protein
MSRLWHCYFLLFAFLLGAFILSGVSWLLPLYFSITYIILGFTFLSVTRFWRDWLNPLSIVLIAGLIRFTIPGFLSLRTDPDFGIFQIMDLERDQWILGHTLALAGLLGAGLGWLMPMRLSGSGRSLSRIGLHPNLRSSRGLPYAAMLGMLIGFTALILFIGSHVPVSEAVSTGEMRGTEIRVGTGKYFHLSLMLIASSVVFSAYLIERRYSWLITSLPAVVAAASFWVLGGRVRAFVPMACVALLLWYRRNELKVPVRTGFALSLILLPVFSYVGQLYRGGMGLEAFSEMFSVSSLVEYVNYAVWLDWGQLHSLAGAVAVGPGVLGGQTFTALLWPLTKFVDLPGKSAGVFIVQRLVGYDDERKWAFHATLIGDAYLNFGILGVFVVTATFGILLKKIYTAFKLEAISPVYYSLAVVYGLRIFFESIEEWSEGLEMIVYAYLLIRFGPILFNVGADRGVTSEKVAVVGHRFRYGRS